MEKTSSRYQVITGFPSTLPFQPNSVAASNRNDHSQVSLLKVYSFSRIIAAEGVDLGLQHPKALLLSTPDWSFLFEAYVHEQRFGGFVSIIDKHIGGQYDINS